MNSLSRDSANERQRRRQRRIQQLQAERDRREAEVCERYPRLEEIKNLQAQIGLDLGRLALRLKPHLGNDFEDLKQRSQALARERQEILAGAGLPANYLEVWWDCPDCQNTGWVGSQRCRCLIQEQIDDLYRSSGLTQALKHQTFEAFDLSLYPQDQRELMDNIRRVCREFAEDVASGRETDNLLLCGGVGLGKTFLCSAIANHCLKANKTVIYITFPDLVDLIRRRKFEEPDSESSHENWLNGVDLVILDDLGAEKVTEFVLQELFVLINHRVNRRLPFVISTNLSLKDLEGVYTSRVYSRIVGTSRILRLQGEDVRLRLRRNRALTEEATG